MAKKEVDPGIFVEIVNDLNDVTGRTGRERFRIVEPFKKLIRGRMDEGATIEDFMYVHRVKAANWLHDSQMKIYLRPATLYCPSKFWNYAGEQMPTQQDLFSETTQKNIVAVARWATGGTNNNNSKEVK